MVPTVLILIGLIGIGCLAGAVQAAPSVAVRTRSIRSPEVYEPVELVLDVRATFDNPFDSREVAVDAEVMQADGSRLRIPAFWYQGYARREAAPDVEELTPEGSPGFRVRFAATVPGRTRVLVRVKARDGSAVSRPMTLTVRRGSRAGFVRWNRTNRRYLRLEGGGDFFPIGENVCMYTRRSGTYYYDRYLPAMAAAGENLARLWMSWYEDGGFTGFPLEKYRFRRYEMADAWRLDHVLRRGQEMGVYAMLCFQSHHEQIADAIWPAYAYNRRNGGPSTQPMDFFTDPEAKAAYRDRLRYIVARWSAFPALAAWELYNEVQYVTGYDARVVGAWHTEMSDALREIDPYDHLISTSYRDAEIFAGRSIDFSQFHVYTGPGPSLPETVATSTAEYRAMFGKPTLGGEFGWDVSHLAQDPEGEHVRKGLWAGALSGGLGAPLYWWWHNYIGPNRLHGVHTGLARFMRLVPLSDPHLQAAEAYLVLKEDGPQERRGLVLRPTGNFGSPCGPSEYAIPANGPLRVLKGFPPRPYIHGPDNHKDLHNPLLFRLEPPRAGRFLVHVGESRGAILHFVLDGREVATVDLPHDNPAGGKVLEDQFGRYTVYDREVGIDLPAGKHTLKLWNGGRDWVSVTHYRLAGYGPVARAAYPLVGLATRRSAYLWLDSGGPASTAIEVRGLADGDYQCRWHDPRTGEPSGPADRVPSRRGVLRLPLAPADHDRAIIIE